MSKPQPPRFYFALPRLLASLRGGDSRRTEMNGAEAWAASLAIFVISYLFFISLVPKTFDPGLTAVSFVVSAFVVWLFWLIALYVNSLILSALRAGGFFRDLPQRRGQGVLLGITTTIMALQLLKIGSFSGEIASIWLTAVAMNLIAAIVLAFRNGEDVRS